MASPEELMTKIKETKLQIATTKSKQRKYQLHRHLAKLWKEWRALKYDH